MSVSAPPATAASRREHLGLIEAGRAFAALFVVAFHANTIVLAHVPDAPRFMLFEIGERGVDFFFVLSGFIITFVHLSDIGQPTRAMNFAWKRFARIYPLLWLVVAGTIAMNIVLDGEIYGFQKLWTSFTLFPSTTWPTPSVAWTLRHELLFYALFGTLILSRGIGSILLLLWLCATLLQTAMLLSGSSLPGVHAMIFSPLNLQFTSGCLVAFLYRTHGGKGSLASLVIGLLLLAAAVATKLTVGIPARMVMQYAASASVLPDLAFAAIFALIVHGLAGASRHVRTPRWLLMLGAASYAIYLVHTSVMGIAGRALPFISPPWLSGIGVAHLVLFLVATAAGVAAHFLFEAPVARWLSTTRFARSTRTLAPKQTS